MSKRQAQLVILCEDRQQEVFARHFFIRYGFHRRKIRSNVCPKGRGAGEQYVRETYRPEVIAYRAKNYLNICLAVVIDADKKTVDERFQQLEGTINPTRQPDERIAIFIPKRNIETWIHYLQGQTVDEEQRYPKLEREGDCKPYADDLVDRCRQKQLEDAPLSLLAARSELQRILEGS